MSGYVQSKGARLYAEAVGEGPAIIFVHEFAGDMSNWECQIRSLSSRYRCITFNARGYPPSDVPDGVENYSQRQAVEDIAAVIDHFGAEDAHVVGLSMGGYAALNFGIAFPDRARSLTIAGAGHGSDPDTREQFLADSRRLADRILAQGAEAGMRDYISGAARRRFAERDPQGYVQFITEFKDRSPTGFALTILGCQLKRPTIYELRAPMQAIVVPTLVIAGDDDDACMAPALFMKKTIPDARLWIVPRTSHNINLEAADAFNRVLLDFIDEVETGIKRGCV